MNEPTVIHANLPEPDSFPALAESINEAFGPLVQASVVDGRLKLVSQGREASFDASGRITVVSNRPYSTVPGVTK